MDHRQTFTTLNIDRFTGTSGFSTAFHMIFNTVINDYFYNVFRFVRTLFNAAQLTAECAIIALVYLERLLTYAEMDIMPLNWRRMVLGSVLLASKVWDDQAVWNVDYCHILKDISVEDM